MFSPSQCHAVASNVGILRNLRAENIFGSILLCAKDFALPLLRALGNRGSALPLLDSKSEAFPVEMLMFNLNLFFVHVKLTLISLFYFYL
jgi:hypothetical protein